MYEDDVRREEQRTQSWPAEPCGAMAGGFDVSTDALVDLLRKLRVKEDLEATLEERQQMMETLKQCKVEMKKKSQEVLGRIDMFVKDHSAKEAAEKADMEQVRQEVHQEEVKIIRLKDKYAELTNREEELQRQVEKHTRYLHLMERMLKFTKFESVRQLADHVESLLHIKDKLWQRESDAQETANELRKQLLTQQNQHHLMRLQKTNTLSQLHSELEEAQSEAHIWERKWNHIQETAAKKTLLLGQIKMATFNLYEMTVDRTEEEECVDISDTEKQLETIKMFIQDHDDIVKQHQNPSQSHNDGQKKKDQKRNQAKKDVASQSKKTF